MGEERTTYRVRRVKISHSSDPPGYVGFVDEENRIKKKENTVWRDL